MGALLPQAKRKQRYLQGVFTSVFTEEDMENIPDPPVVEFDVPLTDFAISTEDVFKLLCKLQPSKSPGPDNLHPRILKELADVLSEPLAILFMKSLETEDLPKDWKSANVTPIFKKGSKADGKNYRPVSLTSVVCKLFESLLRKQLINHLQSNDLLSVHQHGFISGRSCTTNLLEVLDEWTQVLEEGGSIDVVYMDLMKAFDTVPHHRLLLQIRGIWHSR